MAKNRKATAAKRQRERARQEKNKEKAEKRAQRQAERRDRPRGDEGEDPDLAGIVPGPQPPLELE